MPASKSQLVMLHEPNLWVPAHTLIHQLLLDIFVNHKVQIVVFGTTTRIFSQIGGNGVVARFRYPEAIILQRLSPSQFFIVQLQQSYSRACYSSLATSLPFSFTRKELPGLPRYM